MSWQQFVDTNLVGSGCIDKAAIFDVTGNSVWAATPGFQVTPAEIKAVLAGYAKTDSLFSNGVSLGGEKNVCIKADERSIYVKKEKTGYCIVKTKTALIVAHYPETVQPNAAAVAVENLGDYFAKVGY